MGAQVALSRTNAGCVGIEPVRRKIVVRCHFHDDGAEPGAADEFDVRVDTLGLQAPAEFVEEVRDLACGESSAAHAVARLRSRMKTFRAASSAGVSEMVSCFMGSLTAR